MSDWEIRTATHADIPSVLALWRSAGGPPSVTDTPAALEALLARDAGALLIAVESGGGLIGSVIAAFDGWRGNIYRLAVDPALRRRGIATALVGAAGARLRCAGAVRLTAIVIAGEPGAIAFWQAIGYEPQPDRRRFVRSL